MNEKTILHLKPFTRDEIVAIKEICQTEGKTRPQFYHDAIVAYLEKRNVKEDSKEY